MANIKSQIKRNRQNDAAHQRNKSVKSALKTAVRKFREAADSGDAAEAAAGRSRRRAARQGGLDGRHPQEPGSEPQVRHPEAGLLHLRRPRLAREEAPRPPRGAAPLPSDAVVHPSLARQSPQQQPGSPAIWRLAEVPAPWSGEPHRRGDRRRAGWRDVRSRGSGFLAALWFLPPAGVLTLLHLPDAQRRDALEHAGDGRARCPAPLLSLQRVRRIAGLALDERLIRHRADRPTRVDVPAVGLAAKRIQLPAGTPTSRIRSLLRIPRRALMNSPAQATREPPAIALVTSTGAVPRSSAHLSSSSALAA